MLCNVLAVVVLSFASGIHLEEICEHDLSIVSTTQRPSELQQLKDRLTSVENKWEFQSQLNENNRRLGALEIQTNQTLNLLEKMNFALTNITSQDTKSTENNHQSEVLELQNEQILKKLENMSVELENLKNQHTRLETFVLQNQNNSEDINFTVTDIRNLINLNANYPKNCKEVKEKGGSVSKVYLIKAELSSEPFSVWCDMKTRGGGWTYVLNRFDGAQDFYLNWADYKKGFGNLSGEFWIGLDHLHQLTGQEPKELLIKLIDWNQNKPFAHFDKFSIGNEEEGYILKSVGSYTGDAGDSMRYHVGANFSTKDRDISRGSCATRHVGAWWYKNCFHSHLTAKYLSGDPTKTSEGLQWIGFRNTFSYNFKEAKMMIR